MIKIKTVKPEQTADNGFVAYYRTITNKDWYKFDPIKRFLFEHCINCASHKKFKSNFHGRSLMLCAGQIHTSYAQFAAKSGILGFYKHPLVNSKDPIAASKKAVERALDYFKIDGALEYKNFGSGRNKTTVITVKNWANFQSGHVPMCVPKSVPNDIPKSVPNDIPKSVPNDSQLNKEVCVGSVPKSVPNDIPKSVPNDIPKPVPKSVTKNNNTISKDIVNRSVSKQKSQIKKSALFKHFFSIYPTHRKGGTDQTAWKVWKSKGLNDDDAQQAIEWLTNASDSWRTAANGQFVLGITNFIREKMWLTPNIIEKNNSMVSFKNKFQEIEDALDDTSWADNMDEVL